ncbi:MAG: DUF1566 domain-containing protein [Candidatus Electrothrix aestuarii]|uniref:DUF1566 domain-containing protein n=1 Tax=Candidatus Electrothrix aestuarii TaxID=3062594 RepID=A0AAU8LPD8_9BACT|nr:DUF1566 domain-containing protein [Candidatus Electrothrix aestuarii]
MRKIIYLIILLFLFFNTSNGVASNPDIFKITTDNSELTGFFAQGKSGIITALHGVIGRHAINASDDNSSQSYKNLKIEEVDTLHDLAFLSSNELKKRKGGLKISMEIPKKEEKIYSIGYPLGLSYQLRSDQLRVRIPPLTQLLTLLPTKLTPRMATRNSPDISKKVISIEGGLLPGHSGAPVLNQNNEVIGVANGGLKSGTVGICWAIPYNEINWAPKVSREQELSNLETLEVSALFSFSVFKASSGALLEWQEPRAGNMMTWEEANDYVADKNSGGLMGYHDWRLPAVGELNDLAKFIKNSPDSYSDTDKLYWSSEDLGPYSVQAKVVNLGNAQMAWECFDTGQQTATCQKNNRFSVRLVRNLIQ